MSDKRTGKIKKSMSRKKIVLLILVGIIIGAAVGVGVSFVIEPETSIEREHREAKEMWKRAKEREGKMQW